MTDTPVVIPGQEPFDPLRSPDAPIPMRHYKIAVQALKGFGALAVRQQFQNGKVVTFLKSTSHVMVSFKGTLELCTITWVNGTPVELIACIEGYSIIGGIKPSKALYIQPAHVQQCTVEIAETGQTLRWGE